MSCAVKHEAGLTPRRKRTLRLPFSFFTSAGNAWRNAATAGCAALPATVVVLFPLDGEAAEGDLTNLQKGDLIQVLAVAAKLISCRSLVATPVRGLLKKKGS